MRDAPHFLETQGVQTGRMARRKRAGTRPALAKGRMTGGVLFAGVRSEDVVERLRRVDVEIEVIDAVGPAEGERGDAVERVSVDRRAETGAEAHVDRDR